MVAAAPFDRVVVESVVVDPVAVVVAVAEEAADDTSDLIDETIELRTEETWAAGALCRELVECIG
jgi:hypothetical protein